jgi:hypothetical protein
MTPHDHRRLVPGCFRCELGRDEAIDALDDDAIHVRNPGSASRTICDQDVAALNVVSFLDWQEVDWGAGCWGCLTEARDMMASSREKPTP